MVSSIKHCQSAEIHVSPDIDFDRKIDLFEEYCLTVFQLISGLHMLKYIQFWKACFANHHCFAMGMGCKN